MKAKNEFYFFSSKESKLPKFLFHLSYHEMKMNTRLFKWVIELVWDEETSIGVFSKIFDMVKKEKAKKVWKTSGNEGQKQEI